MAQRSIMDFCATDKKVVNGKNKTPPEADADLLSPAKKATKSTKTKSDDKEDDEDGGKLVQLGSNDKDSKKTDKDLLPTTAAVKSASTSKSSSTTPSNFTYENLEDGLPDEWKKALAPEFSKPYWKKLKEQLCSDRDKGVEIFPAVHHIFAAFYACPMDQIRVFLCGQDPYHDVGQAIGLAFAVSKTTRIVPPSLKNMYKELVTDIPGFKTPTHGDISSWAAQGVFMLNTALTVIAHKANSHAGYGWLTFTDAVVNVLSKKEGLVWIAWGKPAEKKVSKIDKKKNLVLTGAHPSPLSAHRGFFGSKPFSQTNEYLVKNGFKPIVWEP